MGVERRRDDIINDERPIARLDYDDEQGTAIIADEETVIEAYGEPAEFCNVPWFRVKVKGEVRWRIPAGKVTVTYAESEREPVVLVVSDEERERIEREGMVEYDTPLGPVQVKSGDRSVPRIPGEE